MREIRINKVLNGFIAVVGCQTVVFTDQSVMFAELARYLTNPAEVEQEYLRKYACNESVAPAISSDERDYRDKERAVQTQQNYPQGAVIGGRYRG